MAPVRRSSRVPRPVGTKFEKPKPLDPLPFFEKAEKWDSPMPACQKQALYGRIPTNTPGTKRQTKRGAYVPSRTKDTWATTDLSSTATASSPKPTKETPEKQQPASPASRRDSAEPLEHKCGLGQECEFSTRRRRDEDDGADTFRTASPTPFDLDAAIGAHLADADLEAATSLAMLRHKTCHAMRREDMRTDFVKMRHETLEEQEGDLGHWEKEGRWVKENQLRGSLTWDEVYKRWVEESQLRNSLKREAEYSAELDRDAKTRKMLSAMLLAHA
jgi:hypothetical protein